MCCCFSWNFRTHFIWYIPLRQSLFYRSSLMIKSIYGSPSGGSWKWVRDTTEQKTSSSRLVILMFFIFMYFAKPRAELCAISLKIWESVWINNYGNRKFERLMVDAIWDGMKVMIDLCLIYSLRRNVGDA